MSKHVLILSGSPRKGGNSDLLCDEFLRGAQEAGNQVEKIFLRSRKIAPCNACYFCKRSGGQCAIRDDMAEVLDKMQAADVIVMASPVYFYSINAQLKAVIDRFYANNEALMVKKKAVFLTAMADEDQKTASGASASFDLMADYLGWEIVGTLNVGGCSTADDLHEEDLTAAYELGKNL